MASVNKVIIVGNLGADPEMRTTQAGTHVATLSVATTHTAKDNKQTEWHKVICWGKTAETCTEYLRKGSTCYVEGRIQTRKWQDKAGETRYSTEIIADTVQFLSKNTTSAQTPVEKEFENTFNDFSN